MTEKEVLKLLTWIGNVYQKKFDFPKNDNKDNKMMIKTWARYLKEYDYKTAQVALDKLIINKPKWPPTVGELVQEIEKISRPERLTAGEAWANVLHAVRRHGVLYGTKKAMNSLDPLTRKAVECVGGIRIIGMSDENDTYMMNRFIKVYNNLEEKEADREYLPGNVRKEVEMLAEKFRGNNPQIEGESDG